MIKRICLSMLLTLAVAGAQAEENTFKEGAKEVGRSMGAAAREVGHGAKKVGLEVAQAAREVGHATRDGAKEFAKAVRSDPADVKPVGNDK